MHKFASIPETTDSRIINKERRFDKRGILDMFEKQYKENEGSLILARGLVEHIFAVKQQL